MLIKTPVLLDGISGIPALIIADGLTILSTSYKDSLDRFDGYCNKWDRKVNQIKTIN